MNDKSDVTVHHRRKLAERADDDVLSVEPVHRGRRRRRVDTQHELQIVDYDVRNVMNVHRMRHCLRATNTQDICPARSSMSPPPFPQIDIIGAVVIVWRVRGKIIRSVLCNIVCNNCAQCIAHTYEQTNSSLDWVLSHWAHFTVLRFIFVL